MKANLGTKHLIQTRMLLSEEGNLSSLGGVGLIYQVPLMLDCE
jgi:hypothetical protein